MATPYEVFRAGTDAQRDRVRMVWKELYEAFPKYDDGEPDPEPVAPVYYCWYGEHTHLQGAARVRAIARTEKRPAGMPACARHLREYGERRWPELWQGTWRPGGWPLPGQPGGGPPR